MLRYAKSLTMNHTSTRISDNHGDAMAQQVLLPVTPMLNPLSQEDLARLQEILETNKAHQDLINRCEQCSLNMEERRARADMHREVAKKLIEQFFPTNLSPPNR